MRIVHVSTINEHPCFSHAVLLQAKQDDVTFIVLRPADDPKYGIIDQYVENSIKYIFIDVARDLDFSPDSELETFFEKLIGILKPDVVHIQLFSGINVLALFRACRSMTVKKIITLHIHSLFCLPGTCYDKGQVCPLNSLDECSCDGCHSLAKFNRKTLLEYNRVRLDRLKEMIALSDAVICCSLWQQNTIRRLVGNECKTQVLYYGVTIYPERGYKTAVTRKEVEAGGLEWNKIKNIAVKRGWANMDGFSTIVFKDIANIERSEAQEFLGDDFIKLSRVVKNPVPRPKKRSSLPSFGYLGSLWGLKGIDLILKSLERNADLPLQIVMAVNMNEADKKDVLQYKELEKHPRISIAANVNRKELYEKFFSQIDYLIIPSVWEETGPMTLFEAFYYKVPVIISKHPSVIEKTTEGINSLVFENEEDLSRLMRRIIEGRGLKTQKTRANFPVKSVRRYTDQLYGIYAGKRAGTDADFGK